MVSRSILAGLVLLVEQREKNHRGQANVKRRRGKIKGGLRGKDPGQGHGWAALTPDFELCYFPQSWGHKARQIWCPCDSCTTEKALEMGLVNKVLPPGVLKAETENWCRKIFEKNPTAIRFMKAAFNADQDHAYGLQAFGHGATHLFYGTEAGKEGRDAFKEKRDPDFPRFRCITR